jgi:hypothetical protein
MEVDGGVDVVLELGTPGRGGRGDILEAGKWCRRWEMVGGKLELEA